MQRMHTNAKSKSEVNASRRMSRISFLEAQAKRNRYFYEAGREVPVERGGCLRRSFQGNPHTTSRSVRPRWLPPSSLSILSLSRAGEWRSHGGGEGRQEGAKIGGEKRLQLRRTDSGLRSRSVDRSRPQAKEEAILRGRNQNPSLPSL